MLSLLLCAPFALLVTFYLIKPLRPALQDRGLVLALCITPLGMALALEFARSTGLFRWVLQTLGVLAGLAALAGSGTYPLISHLMEKLVDDKQED
jgi:hypothetical protein